MQLRVRNRKDLYAGLIFIVFGALFAVIARDYPMGSALRMGPAYFPIILGSMLVVLGAIIAARSLFIKGEPIPPFGYRELALILGDTVRRIAGPSGARDLHGDIDIPGFAGGA